MCENYSYHLLFKWSFLHDCITPGQLDASWSSTILDNGAVGRELSDEYDFKELGEDCASWGLDGSCWTGADKGSSSDWLNEGGKVLDFKTPFFLGGKGGGEVGPVSYKESAACVPDWGDKLGGRLADNVLIGLGGSGGGLCGGDKGVVDNLGGRGGRGGGLYSGDESAFLSFGLRGEIDEGTLRRGGKGGGSQEIFGVVEEIDSEM